MAVTIPTFEDIKALIIGDIESALSQTIPILPKAVFRRLAGALAGAWLILYKYNSDAHRERFVQTASLEFLKKLGELVGGRDHSTVIYAIDTFNDMVETKNIAFNTALNKVREEINNHISQTKLF